MQQRASALASGHVLLTCGAHPAQLACPADRATFAQAFCSMLQLQLQFCSAPTEVTLVSMKTLFVVIASLLPSNSPRWGLPQHNAPLVAPAWVSKPYHRRGGCSPPTTCCTSQLSVRSPHQVDVTLSIALALTPARSTSYFLSPFRPDQVDVLPLERFNAVWRPDEPERLRPVFVERVTIREALAGPTLGSLLGSVQLVEPTFQVRETP